MGNFTPVNDLEKLLIDSATDVAARPAFYRALAEGELFVITEGQKPDKEEQYVLPEGAKLELRVIERENKPYVAIFSSKSRISPVDQSEIGFIAMKGLDLFKMVRNADLWLNPGSDYGKILTQKEVESILDGSIFQPQEKLDVGGQQILLGQPKEYPEHVTVALSNLFSRGKVVKAAYLAHAFLPTNDKTPHTLIGLDVAGEWEEAIKDIGVVLREVTKPGEIVDLVRVDPKKPDPISSYMRDSTKPFYKKKVLGIF
jgi:hypothetical protein